MLIFTGLSEDISTKYYKNNNSKQSLKIDNTNSPSLRNKVNEQREIAAAEKPIVIGINKSWMNVEHKYYKAEYVMRVLNYLTLIRLRIERVEVSLFM